MHEENNVKVTFQVVTFDIFQTDHTEVGLTLSREKDPADEGVFRDVFIDPETMEVSGLPMDWRQRSNAVGLARLAVALLEASMPKAYVLDCLDQAEGLVRSGQRPDGTHCDTIVAMWEK
jgi:hypothetical protein